MAVAIETKTVTASKDPLIQLGFTIVALHRRLTTIRGPDRLSPLRRITTLPIISVVDHGWAMYFAVDCHTRIVGPPYLPHGDRT